MRAFGQRSLWSILLTLLSVVIVSAQANQCSIFLDEALSALEDNCDGTGRNEACYGYNQISASFISDVSDDFFTQPSDKSAIAELASINTAPFNANNSTWGVALMNIQANLPNTLPGQSVTFILMGDMEVENAVDPENAFNPSDGVEIAITSPAGANIRSGAGLNFNVIGGVRPEETLLTDGISEDGAWYRVAYDDRVAWINEVVFDTTTEGLADLPTLTDDLQTPMQAFYLRTGIGQTDCTEAPDDLLIVQGPEDIEVNITANGADIRIGSTVGLRTIEIDGELFLEVIAISGEIEFMGQILRPGQRSLACLGESDSRGLDGEDNDLTVTCEPTPPETAENFGEDWCVLERLPTNLLNYDIEILCPGETPAVVTNTNRGGGATSSNVATVDCSTMSLISPLSPVNSGNHTFSWTPAQGDNITYQLVFWDFAGNEVESFYTSETLYNINLGLDTSTGGEFSWEVRAYQNGTYACVTFRSPQLTRTGELNPVVTSPGADPVFTASRGACFDNGSTYETTVSWANAPSTPVTIDWEDDAGLPGSTSSGAISGSANIQTGYYFYTFTYIDVTAGGQTISLGGC